MLNQRDRRLLGAATLIQVSLSLLDILGLFLIGIVAALSMSVIGGTALPGAVERITGALGLSGIAPTRIAVWAGLVAALVLITKTFVSTYLTRRVLRFLASRQAVVSGRLVESLLSQPLIMVQRRSSQETSWAMTNGVTMAVLIVLGQSSVAISEAALLVMVTVGLFLVSPGLTLFSLLFFAAVGIVTYRLLSGWAGRIGRDVTKLDVASLEAIQESLATYRELSVTGRRAWYVDRVQLLRWRAAAVTADSQFIGLAPKYIFEVALVIGAGLLAVSQLFTRDVAAAVAVIAVFLAAGTRVVPSLLRMQGAMISVRSAGMSARPTYELGHELLSLDGAANREPLAETEKQRVRQLIGSGYVGFDASIAVSAVTMTFPGARAAAVEDVSFALCEGSSLALVGATGAGKSTLADVILGVLSPESGTVQIGGHDPQEAISRWPGAIAYVPQAIALINGTVRGNVGLGLDEAQIDDSLVREALERAHLAEFLRGKREGLDTLIGEGGVMLSGGQRQRLGIARALFTRPRLLVLDEATSALDAETEEAIARTMQELEGSVTTVTVAHRLATIRHCDLVLYLEGGRIVAQGTFDEVRQQSERFDAQARLLGMA